MTISITFDIEKDLHSGDCKGITDGIPRILSILDKYGVKATFFTTAKIIEKFPQIFQALKKQRHEVALHGYAHERFDDLTFEEADEKISESVKIYRKVFGENPQGFRAPQHSIDKKTLEILKKNDFVYDSSYTPFNIFQILFFLKKFRHELKGFFSPREKYKILKDFYEIPVSSFLIPFVSLPLRVFPFAMLKIYLWILRKTNKNLVFYAHSWDFINLPNSKIDKMFSHKIFMNRFEKIISLLSKHYKFVTINNLVK
ncbi:MAG: polysaccharide deacetylase family protein [archaeon]|nr:polysaccharide deacetylase family protein [archaeon]